MKKQLEDNRRIFGGSAAIVSNLPVKLEEKSDLKEYDDVVFDAVLESVINCEEPDTDFDVDLLS